MKAAQTLENETEIGVTSDADQFLTFMLDGEEYGLDILRVQEIKGWDTVTSIPNTPEYIRGVINLRGTIVPIIDLRRRFGLEAKEYGPTTVVIVLRVDSADGRSRVMGIVVDAVSDVYNISEDDLKPPPDFGAAINVEYVKGIATVQDKMVIGLDIDHLMNGREMESLDRLAE